MIYEGAPSLQLPAIAAVIAQKLQENFRCLYLNRPTMVSGIRSALSAIGVDVEKVVSEGRLQLSSETHLTSDGGFDVDGMLRGLEEALDQSIKDGYQGMFATGDMSWEFGSEKNLIKLMDYEFRLEKIFRRRSELCGICQYHKDTLPAEAIKHGVLTHPSIFINETLVRENPYFVPSGSKEDRLASDLELDELISELCS